MAWRMAGGRAWPVLRMLTDRGTPNILLSEGWYASERERERERSLCKRVCYLVTSKNRNAIHGHVVRFYEGIFTDCEGGRLSGA